MKNAPFPVSWWYFRDKLRASRSRAGISGEEPDPPASHPGDAGCHEEQKMGPEQSQTPLPGQSKSEERYYGTYDNFAAAGSL